MSPTLGTVPIRLQSGVSHVYSMDVSPKGELSICYSVTQNHEVRQIMMLYKLGENASIEFSVEAPSQAGFFDDRMILLTDGLQFRECSVDLMWDERSVDCLELLRTKRYCWKTELASLNATHTILYSTSDGLLYEYNVKTRVDQLINQVYRSRLVVSRCGIATPGVRCVFQCDGNVISALNDKNKVFFVRNGFSHYLLPSSLDEGRLCMALWMDPRKMLYDGSELETPPEWAGVFNMVRLYHDYFLLFDDVTKSFVIRRISVM